MNKTQVVIDSLSNQPGKTKVNVFQQHGHVFGLGRGQPCPPLATGKLQEEVEANTCVGSFETHRVIVLWRVAIQWVDEIHFAPPVKPWNDESTVHTNRRWFPMASKWREMDFVHSQDVPQKSYPWSKLGAEGNIDQPPCGHDGCPQQPGAQAIVQES